MFNSVIPLVLVIVGGRNPSTLFFYLCTRLCVYVVIATMMLSLLSPGMCWRQRASTAPRTKAVPSRSASRRKKKCATPSSTSTPCRPCWPPPCAPPMALSVGKITLIFKQLLTDYQKCTWSDLFAPYLFLCSLFPSFVRSFVVLLVRFIVACWLVWSFILLFVLFFVLFFVCFLFRSILCFFACSLFCLSFVRSFVCLFLCISFVWSFVACSLVCLSVHLFIPFLCTVIGT